MADNLGRFFWYELLTTDPEAARAFYQSLVGWGHTVWDGAMPYQMFTIGEQPYAGLMQLPEEAQAAGAPSHWLGYIGVPDRDAALAKALDLGATELVKMDVPEVGKFAVIQDPQGATIAIYKPAAEPEGDEPDPEPGQVSWHELATSDLDAGWGFYREMFGWDLMQDVDMGEMGTYRIFGRNGKQRGGIWPRPPQMPVSAWLYYVKSPNVHDEVAKIGELGGNVVNGPMEVPGGDHILQAIDPTGAMFAMHSVGSAGGD